MIIQSKKVWFADQFVEAQVEVKDGKIVDIYEYGTKPVDQDYGSNWILPGFIDIHCHGAYGFDTNDAEEEGLRYWVKNIVNEGVTALLATTITQSEEVLTNALKNVAKVVNDGYEGAEILGVHFEGPYLDMKYKGAQPEQYIVKPTIEQFKKYQEAAVKKPPGENSSGGFRGMRNFAALRCWLCLFHYVGGNAGFANAEHERHRHRHRNDIVGSRGIEFLALGG